MSRKDDYHRFLGSDAWDKKRRAAYAIHGRRCAKCGTTRGRFQVHHLRYPEWGTEDPRTDLQILCRKCHRAEHRLPTEPVGGGRSRYYPGRRGRSRTYGPTQREHSNEWGCLIWALLFFILLWLAG